MSVPQLHDFSPDVAMFAQEVLEGLRESPKSIPCKFLYDETGSKLFEQICELDEYYPTRAEIAILVDHAKEMAELLGGHCLLIEYGSGSSLKTPLLLDWLVQPSAYMPIDISKEHLLASAKEVKSRYPDLEVLPVCADYTGDFELPPTKDAPRRRAVFFPGSTLGNFGPAESIEFLQHVAEVCGRGGAFLIGLDLKKDRAILERAYNDAKGVTATFNRNLLVRINREIGGDFRLDRFRHRAFYNEEAGRIEMHLVSVAAQTVQIDGEAFSFEKGETIWTESSYKFGIDEFRETAGRVGFNVEKIWTDRDELFSVQLLTVPSGGPGEEIGG